MGELGDKLRAALEPSLDPGEILLGSCVATQQSTFQGRQVAVGVTAGRLLVQGMNRRFEPDGPVLSLPPEVIADASAAFEWGGFDETAARADQHVVGPKDHGRGLLVLALDRHEAHGWALRSLADRFGIGQIVLLPLHEGLHIGWCDQLR